jgi:16S rRNA processing protein RimM
MSVVPANLSDGETPVVVGKVSGVFGIKGWVKVLSHTRPRDNLLEFDPWLIHGAAGWEPCRVVDSGHSGGALTAKLDVVETRDAAQMLVGKEIAVHRSQLPRLPSGQYYWFELVGLRVVTGAGREFGQVTGLLETGANDVLEVAGAGKRILIPFVPGAVVEKVDRIAGSIQVNWDPEYQ